MNTHFAGTEDNLVSYYPTTEGNGTTINDLSASHNNGTLSSTGVTWAVNKDFVYYVTGNMNSDIKVNQMSINDVDAGSGNMELSLSVLQGVLNFENVNGLTFESGSNGSSSITVNGTKDALNSALGSLSYRPLNNYNGPDSLTAKVDDLGNTGTGGDLSDTQVVSINVLNKSIPAAGFNNGLEFNGNNYVDLGSGVKLGQNFTEEVWIYDDITDNDYHGILGNEVSSDDHAYHRAPGIWIYDKTKVHVGFGTGTEWCNFVSNKDVLTFGEWNHIAVTYDNGTYSLYVNGRLECSQKMDKTSFDTPVKFIGKVDNNFPGKIDEVRLWTKALSQEEIKEWESKQITSG